MTAGVQTPRTFVKGRQSSSGICNPSTPLGRWEKDSRVPGSSEARRAYLKVELIHKVLLRWPHTGHGTHVLAFICACLCKWVSHTKKKAGREWKRKGRKHTNKNTPSSVGNVFVRQALSILSLIPRIHIKKKKAGHNCLFVTPVLEMNSQCSQTSQPSLLNNPRAVRKKKKRTAP